VKYILWLLKAAIFFTLFAFALNNQQVVPVNFFFGTVWQAPQVLVVLAAFTAGVALGILVMVPRWWKNRRSVATTKALAKNKTVTTASSTPEDAPHGV
jgi:putative membrane protein